MSDHTTEQNDVRSHVPIWHSPAWITAIVGLVSVFLTVPEILGNYLTKQQDIKLAEEKTEAARLENVESKQDQEFGIVNNTLAQQGTERVFVLRYLAATLDDEEAKGWAKTEVERLDTLAARQESLEKAKREFEGKEKSLLERIRNDEENSTSLQLELDELREKLNSKNAEVAELRQNAGISTENGPTKFYLIRAQRKEIVAPDANADSIWIEHGPRGSRCRFVGIYCQVFAQGTPPSEVEISSAFGTDHSLFSSLSISTFTDFSGEGNFYTPTVIPYPCLEEGDHFVCTRKTD